MDIQEAKVLANQLISQHLPGLGWTLEINYKTRRRLGCCKYGPRKICLTHWYVTHNDVELVRDTILHEIAHALTHIHFNERGHGPRWKYYCVKLGARPERCWKKPVAPASAYRAVCADPNCGKTYYSHRRPRRATACQCQRPKPVIMRELLRWGVNPAYAPGVAAEMSASTSEFDGGEIESLVQRLASSVDPRDKKKIRARLRALGHKGGLR